MFTLTSGAFASGESIPDLFTCEGDAVSPALTWSGEPAGTRGFALIMDDPDAPDGTWNHWLLWDIPAGHHSLPQHYRAAGPVQSGTNDFGKTGYGGPCPPKRSGGSSLLLPVLRTRHAGIGPISRSRPEGIGAGY